MTGLLDAKAAIARARVSAILYAALTLVCLIWLSLDSRALPTGDVAPLKPLKFALSLGVHFATIAILGAWTHRAQAQDRWFAIGVNIQVVAALIEMLAITLQGARGVQSHFNVGTPFDAAVFTIMGIGVAALTFGLALMLAGLALHRGGPSLARAAVALGLIGLFVGSATGVAMVSPTAEQAALIAEGARPSLVGSYSVGAYSLEAEPGVGALPFFGWSLEVGDWRAPHFLGIHALQAIPLLAWLVLATSLTRPARASLFATLATAYFAFLGWSVLATLQGRSILAIDPSTLAAACLAVLLLALAGALAWRRAAEGPT